MKNVIYSDKVNKDLLFKLYSDLHYNPEDNLSYLERSIERAKNNNIDYAFFLGDLIDDSKYNINDLKKLMDLLSRLSKYTKIILVLGNHDQFTKNKDGNWVDYDNKELIDILKNIGVIVLQNEYYLDDNINIYGTKFNGSYYEKQEPIKEFSKNIEKIKYDDLSKFNILLEHSPKNTFNSDIISKFDNLNNLDLILAGHYHNGCVPWYLSKILLGNSGIIDPYNNLFPKNSRESKYITENIYGKVISPLRTFSSKSIFNNVNNIFYTPEEQYLLIKKNK